MWGENEGDRVQMTEATNGVLVQNYIYRDVYNTFLTFNI